MIDQFARSSAADLRSHTATDAEAGLADLHVRQAQRHRRTTVTAVAAVALALGVGWTARSAATQGGAEPSPTGPPPSASPSVPSVAQGGSGDPCRAERVTCIDDTTYRYALTQPVTWHLPFGYGADSGGGATRWMVESYAQSSGGPYQYDSVNGVSVLEGVRAASPDGRSAQPGVADTPRGFVSWLAAQPYLSASSIVTTRLDGRPAWRVRVQLAPGADQGVGVCTNDVPCHPTTFTPDQRTTGIWGDMVADYTAVHVPGAGTTVVWSWAFAHDRPALARNRHAVAGLSWER